MNRNPNYRGGRVKQYKYWLIRIPSHPRASNGYVREHDWIVEQFIGRPLMDNEDVHHINGNTFDNRIENLVLLSHSDHGCVSMLTRLGRKQEVDLIIQTAIINMNNIIEH